MTSDVDDHDSPDKLKLRLFVSGATPRSLRAIGVVRKLCEAAATDGYSLEVVDVFLDPAAARDNQIVALPTLVKLAPTPKRRFIGDMSDTVPLAAGLGLAS